MNDNVENSAAEAAAEPVQLSLQDIATMAQIVDLCSKRGAFEGSELEAVGGLRNRIVKFLEANQPEEGAAPEGTVPEVTTEVDATEDTAEA
jgi:hypothetical protein